MDSVVLDLLSRGSFTAATILIIWSLVTEKLIPKGRLDDCIKSRDSVIKQRDKMSQQLLQRNPSLAQDIIPYGQVPDDDD